jgi:hypothetical protein
MGLLAPAWLLGILAAGLPIYVHLLKRHKTDPVPFSSLMFFEQRTQSSVKHRRLQYLLLLALRIALIALLALAFANPFRKRALSAAAGEGITVVAVDESFSMRTAEGAGLRLDDAKRQAQEVLNSRGGARGQVLALGTTVRVLTDPTTNNDTLRNAITSIQPAAGRGSYGELVRAIRSLTASEQARLNVHLFSDMQKSAMPEGFADLQLPESAKLTLHAVGKADTQNWAVESISAPANVQDTKAARVQVTVAGYGTPATTRTVTLSANGKVLGTKDAEIPENGRATVEFVGLDIPYGFAKGEAKIEGRDSLAADDSLLFSVERADPRRVLLIHESKDTRSPIFFRDALAAGTDGSFGVDAIPVEQSAGIDPSRSAFVVVSDVMSLPANVEAQLKRYVQGGGAVLVAVGTNSARRQQVPIVGDRITEAKYFTRAGERFGSIGAVDTLHASVRNANRWEGMKVYYQARITPGADSKIVVRMADQSPLLYEDRLGEGRVLVFASGFDNYSNDFPVIPTFVPFVEQTARYLTGLEDRHLQANVGTPLELRTARERSVSVEIIDPKGNRPLSLSEASKAQSYTVETEGFWEFRRANGRHEMVAVNPDRRESNLIRVPDETLVLWTGGKGPQTAQTTGAGVLAEEPAEETVSYWWYVLMCMLVVAVAESFVASRYLGARQEAA